MTTRCALIAATLFAGTTAFAAPSTTDTDFVMRAAQAGMAEVAAGKMAESNGQAASVKSFGKRMVADHTKAGDELKQIAGKKGVMMPTSPSDEQKKAGQRLQGLKGAEFDKAYAAQMVKDHEDAVTLFENESDSGMDPDLKAFAKKTLPTLQEHLTMAKALPEGAMSKAK
jgi:putative membrane protein